LRAGGFHPNVQPILESAIAAIKSAGATVIDPVEVKTFGKFGDAVYQVLSYEFKATLNVYLRSLGPDAKVRSLEDVIAFNEKHRDREMPFFGQETFLERRRRTAWTVPPIRRLVTKPGGSRARKACTPR
jgi:amidase